MMKSRSFVVLMALISFLAGCATVGPGPTNQNYKQAMETLPMVGDTLYSIAASWYPNILLGDASSFHHGYTSISGRLFITPKKLVFAVYEGSTNSFLQGYEVVFSNITWMTGRIHGVSRIIRFQSNNTIQSFLFSGWTEIEGGEVTSDQILKYILGRVQSEK